MSSVPRARADTSSFKTAPSAPLKFTGIPTDLAVDGDGFFILRDPATKEMFLTRVGDFQVDAKGFLISFQGFRLQGFNSPIRVGGIYAAGDQAGDLKMDKGTLPAGLSATATQAGISTINIDSLGRINVLLSDGSQYIRGQVLLRSAQDSQALVKRWLYYYGLAEGDDALTRASRPGEGTFGHVVSGALDASAPLARGISQPIFLDRIRGETEVWIVPAAGLAVVEVSENLADWAPIRTNRYDSFSMRFIDDAARDAGVRFYRVVSPVIQWTGKATDLAISGLGYFVVRNPKTGARFVTRAGNFQLDDQKFLITPGGLRVQGYTAPIELSRDYSDESLIWDLQFDKGNPPRDLPLTAATAQISSTSIDFSGRIDFLFTDGTQYTRGQILLQNFSNPFALVKLGNNLYSGIELAGQLPRPGRPNSQSLGRITSGALEYSRDVQW